MRIRLSSVRVSLSSNFLRVLLLVNLLLEVRELSRGVGGVAAVDAVNRDDAVGRGAEQSHEVGADQEGQEEDQLEEMAISGENGHFRSSNILLW